MKPTPTPAPVDTDIVRISGKGRCETAIMAANQLKEQLGVERFDTIIVASGTNFADALAGSYLAADRKAPILLYQASAMTKVVNYIVGSLSEDGVVYLLGGSAAVPEKLAETLLEAGIRVDRLSGKTRFDTNLAILSEVGVQSGDEVLVATGYNFADSLSASATGKPILLVNSKTGKLTMAQKNYLSRLGDPKLTILGGTGAVSEKLAEALGEYGEVTRLSGKSRYETSVLIAETYFEQVSGVVLAYGKNFPDGLSGGPVAHVQGAPLILTAPGAEAAARKYASEQRLETAYIMGGTGALSEETVYQVFSK